MTENETAPWLAKEVVEETLLEASQGNRDAELRILEIVKQVPEASAARWPKDCSSVWTSGIEFLLEEWTGESLSATQRELVLAAARAGIDHPQLRDTLGTLARKRFTEYLDPAGMIEALGILDGERPLAETIRRWRMFEVLAPKRWCWHPVHGAGTVHEVDDLANEIVVKFKSRISFATGAFLDTLTMVAPDSPIESICAGTLAVTDALANASSRDALAEDLLTSDGNPNDALQALLPETASAAARKTSKTANQTDKPASDSTGRVWDQARSPHELLNILRKTETVQRGDDSAAAMETLLGNAAPRQDYAVLFAETVARLRQLAGRDRQWLNDILSGLRDSIWSWQNPDTFAETCDELPGKLIPQWLRACRDTLGVDQLTRYASILPLRLWPQVEKALQKHDGAREKLIAAAVEATQADPPSADAAVWLWKSKAPEKQVLADATLVFRLLARPVSGAYIKAAKQLRKMLMTDEGFQRFLLHDGDETAVSALVQGARSLSVLSSGETQSLLVRIVRLFPAAKPLVEKKQQKTVMKAMPKATSIRMYEQYRQELRDIINVRIPENSRAIAHARSYGDLRENAEYKAAKEEQAYLTARRHELEVALADIRATDFTDVELEHRVIPGCTVTLKLQDGTPREHHVMGLWDSDPDKSILSYDTPLGRVLLGTQKGDTVTGPNGEDITIDDIRPLSPELLEWAKGE